MPYFRYFLPQLRRCSGLVSFGQRSSFWIVLHVSVTVELSSLCDEDMQDVQLENFLLMKEDAPLEEAKQGQSKGKGLEFDIVRSERCYNGQLISADIS